MPESFSVAVCADEAYALYAVIALRSAALHCQGGAFHGYVFDCGITPPSRARCERVLRSADIPYTWLTVDMDRLGSLPTATWVSAASNARLLMPHLLPDHVEEVLYLDSDVLVVSDIAPVFETFDTSFAAAAARDTPVCAQVGDSQISDILTSYGLHKTDPYFNAGVVLLNIKRWKSEGLGEQMLDLIASDGERFIYRNQTPMNIVLRGQWQEVDPTWNVTSSAFFDTDHSPESILSTAKILHFTHENPGTPLCEHPAESLFLTEVKQSGYFSTLEYLRWRASARRERVAHQVKARVQSLRARIALRTRVTRAWNKRSTQTHNE